MINHPGCGWLNRSSRPFSHFPLHSDKSSFGQSLQSSPSLLSHQEDFESYLRLIYSISGDRESFRLHMCLWSVGTVAGGYETHLWTHSLWWLVVCRKKSDRCFFCLFLFFHMFQLHDNANCQVLMKEALPLCLSVPLENAWPLWLLVTVKGEWQVKQAWMLCDTGVAYVLVSP